MAVFTHIAEICSMGYIVGPASLWKKNVIQPLSLSTS